MGYDLQLAISVLILLAVFVGIFISYREIKKHAFTNPTLEFIRLAALPYINHAIMAVYKASDYAVDTFGHRLEAIDKRKLASSIYACMPDSINVHGLVIPFKQFVSEGQFESMVQSAFDEFIKFYMDDQADLEKFVEEWARDNQYEPIAGIDPIIPAP